MQGYKAGGGRAAGFAVAVLVALTACSGSSPSSGSSNSPLTIGLISTFTGAHAFAGPGMLAGAQFAVNIINSNGGVLGTHHLTLVTQDDSFDPGDALPAAQKEIQSDGVVAIVGPSSATAAVVLPLASKANIPMLMFGGGDAFDKVTDPHFYRMSASDTEQSYAMAVYAHSKGWDKVAIALGNADVDQAILPGIQYAAQKLGMTITATVTFVVGSTSFRSELQTLFAGHPQAILGQADINAAPTMFSQMRQLGLAQTPWVASNTFADAAFFAAVGPTVASGPIYIANPGAGGSIGLPWFLDAWSKAYPNLGPTQRPGILQETMYDAVMTWALGVAEAGTWNEPQINSGILKASNGPGTPCADYVTCYNMIKAGKAIAWEGAASNTKFDKYHNVFGPFDVLQYKADGTFATLTTITADQVRQALGG
jgi:ABC-type branched-subunit amino acid transport system substrate-binding protein